MAVKCVKRTNCLGNEENANHNEMLFSIYEDDESGNV